VRDLPPLAACADRAALVEAVPPPLGSSPLITALRKRLDAAEARSRAGSYTEAIASAAAIAPEVRRIPYPRLLADVLTTLRAAPPLGRARPPRPGGAARGRACPRRRGRRQDRAPAGQRRAGRRPHRRRERAGADRRRGAGPRRRSAARRRQARVAGGARPHGS